MKASPPVFDAPGLTRSIIIAGLFSLCPATFASDISKIPFWDGETVDARTNGDIRLFNRFGGSTVGGTRLTISHVTTKFHIGTGSFQFLASVPIGSFGFSSISMTGFGPNSNYIDTRNIAYFTELTYWLKNETGAAFNFVLEIKDYRDVGNHRARFIFAIGAGNGWEAKTAPLPATPANGWIIDGSPDLSRAKLLSFIIEANAGSSVGGSLFMDDLSITEPGPPLDSATAPINDLVRRISQRQFVALWGSRDRNTGMVPLNSQFADVVALNSTAGLIQILDRAVKETWITRSEADEYVQTVLQTMHVALNNSSTYGGGFVPPRYMDRVTLMPSYSLEESPVDAAFLFLALYKYEKLPETPLGLHTSIQTLLDRFNFSAFSSSSGWKLAYNLQTDQFTAGAYDGYSGEIYLISLAAHLSATHHVPIGVNYHSGVFRSRTFLDAPSRAHLVHSSANFRAPFLQWLFSLFVETRWLGQDTFPISTLAGNPRSNAILYQKEVHAYLSNLGRGTLLQPDASDNGTTAHYEQFSAYNNFGQPELLMPWSVAFSFLAEPAAAGLAFRNILAKNLHGPLGLQDSARWFTGTAEPASYPARIDYWNLALSEMALLEYLNGDNRFLASLPEVRAALSFVFKGTAINLAKNGNQNVLSFMSEAAVNYTLQSSDDLIHWTDIIMVEGTGNLIELTHLDATSIRKFFRVVID